MYILKEKFAFIDSSLQIYVYVYDIFFVLEFLFDNIWFHSCLYMLAHANCIYKYSHIIDMLIINLTLRLKQNDTIHGLL